MTDVWNKGSREGELDMGRRVGKVLRSGKGSSVVMGLLGRVVGGWEKDWGRIGRGILVIVKQITI